MDIMIMIMIYNGCDMDYSHGVYITVRIYYHSHENMYIMIMI